MPDALTGEELKNCEKPTICLLEENHITIGLRAIHPSLICESGQNRFFVFFCKEAAHQVYSLYFIACVKTFIFNCILKIEVMNIHFHLTILLTEVHLRQQVISLN